MFNSKRISRLEKHVGFLAGRVKSLEYAQPTKRKYVKSGKYSKKLAR